MLITRPVSAILSKQILLQKILICCLQKQIFLSTVAGTANTMFFQYPEARRDDTVRDNYHGTEIGDPYRWLEDPDSEETKKFVSDQNSLTEPYIKSCKYREKINKRITELWDYEKVSAPQRSGDKYFQFRNTGLQNQNVLYKKLRLEGKGDVLLDPNLLSQDGTISLSGTAFSENGATLAYGLSTGGSDWLEIKFKDVGTGKDYDDVLRNVKFSPMTWLHNNEAIFYGAYLDKGQVASASQTTAVENQKLYYHKVGTDQTEDIVVAESDDPKIRLGAEVSHCGRYLVVTPKRDCKNNTVYYADIDDSRISGKLRLEGIITQFEADFDYITNDDKNFIFLTNKNAPNYKLVTINFDDPRESEWKDLVPEDPKDVLEWALPINHDKLVICYLRDCKNILQLHDLNTGGKIHDFKLNVGSVISATGKRHHDEFFYSFCSFLTPNEIYRVDFSRPDIQEELFHVTKAGNVDSSKFETKQVFYQSKDGTRVPMFIVHKKNITLDGSRACMLYGYGGFDISITPSFSISRLVFVDNFDGVSAIANIRGGGEYGDKWHNGGRFGNKQNCFDDFQYAAKYLIDNKYTSSTKLVIQGGSNGGLLVAACSNQAPELFGASIAHVGVMDMLRFHKFTIGFAWKSDYGCAEDPNQFKYLYKYSPLHNIPDVEDLKGKQYPAMLLLTADHDDRVVPLHSLKFIAELQHKLGKSHSQKNAMMIRIETKAGHGSGKPTSKTIMELTDIFCFISNALSLPFYT